MINPERSDLPLVAEQDSIRRTMTVIEDRAKGIALVVDAAGRLVATVTDGDIRRALLAGLDLDLPVRSLLEQRAPAPHPSPVTAPSGTPAEALLALMTRYSLRQIPLVDAGGRVCALAVLGDLASEPGLSAVITAGGYGRRLHPLTESTPKPLLSVGDRTILERIVGQLRDAGIRRIHVTTHFLGDRIKDHLGDGRRLDVTITYVSEDRPLGTAGALGLMESPTKPILVVNGDILTRLDFRSLLDFHREQAATMTVAVKPHSVHVPYGVVEVRGSQIVRIVEKPSTVHLVLAGVYLLDPRVWRYLNPGESCEMTDLIDRLIGDGYRVASFPVNEYWLDIGRAEDYERAQADVANGRF